MSGRLDHNDVRRNLRHAGDIKRYHEWPVLNEQTVAAHSWNVMRIWVTIFGHGDSIGMGEASVLKYIMYHDCGELGVGDIPFPVKRNNPSLKLIVDELEAEQLKRMGVYMPILNDWQRKTVKIADLLEMAEFGQHEIKMGNRFCEPVFDATVAAVHEMLEDVSLGSNTKRLVKEYALKSLGVFV